jgi:hypothetical protein
MHPLSHNKRNKRRRLRRVTTMIILLIHFAGMLLVLIQQPDIQFLLHMVLRHLL